MVTILHEDFSTYPNSLLAKLTGAAACIWTVGGIAWRFPSVEMARKLNVNLAVEAAIAFAKTLAPQLPEGKKFRFVYCSGRFAEREFEAKSMWMFKESRSMKRAVENELIAVRKQYEERLETAFMRPAAVVAEKSMVMALPFSSSLAVGLDLVGAVMVDLAVNGSSEEIIDNVNIIRLGKSLVKG